MIEQANFKSFWHNQQGAIAIIFALLVVPLVMVAGLAVDYSRIATARSTLQEHLNSAVWAAAYMPNQNEKERVNFGANHFWAATPDPLKLVVTGIEWGMTPDGSKITGTVHATVPTTLLKLANISSSHFTVTADSNLPSGPPPGGGEEETTMTPCEPEPIRVGGMAGGRGNILTCH